MRRSMGIKLLGGAFQTTGCRDANVWRLLFGKPVHLYHIPAINNSFIDKQWCPAEAACLWVLMYTVTQQQPHGPVGHDSRRKWVYMSLVSCGHHNINSFELLDLELSPGHMLSFTACT